MSDTNENVRQDILRIVENLTPYDELESQHRGEVIFWVKSGAPLCRIEKPDKPPKHLVSYFVLLDLNRKKLLLVDHIKAQLWLPTGGHVEPDENPQETVIREANEELGLVAQFLPEVGPIPLFLTSTVTVGLTAGHTDVSLWYILSGDSSRSIDFDTTEFNDIHWFDIDEILNMAESISDPHMIRFTRKLLEHLEKTASLGL